MPKTIENVATPVVDKMEKSLDDGDVLLDEIQDLIEAGVDAPQEVVKAAVTEARSQFTRLRKETVDVIRAAVSVVSNIPPK